MSDYRRFVSYIYAYKNGKKERNVGFAKVEVRAGRLKIYIQLDGIRNDMGGLDVYGFIRKQEKLYGIFLGEMEKGMQPIFRTEGNPGDIRESGYSLNEVSGLWMKGNRGENYITIWDDEPVSTMELEVEFQVEEPEVVEVENEAAAESELEATVETEVESAEEIAEAEAEPVTEVELDTEGLVEAAEIADLEEVPKEPAPEKPLNGVRAQEAAGLARIPDYRDVRQLFPSCPQVMPFPENEVKDCIRITPRELYLFRKQDWNPQRNNFVLHGYYQFRHLLFGCFADGTHFLGVPGYLNPKERQNAAAFGFPMFKEAREQQRNGRFGYWCRPIE